MTRLNKGKVESFDERKGFGFIIDDQGRLIFAHFSRIDMEGYKTLECNEEVEYDLYESSRGLEAHNIKRLGVRA